MKSHTIYVPPGALTPGEVQVLRREGHTVTVVIPKEMRNALEISDLRSPELDDDGDAGES